MTKDELLAELADIPGDMEICILDQEWDVTFSVTDVRVIKAKLKESFQNKGMKYPYKNFLTYNERLKKQVVVLT